MSISPARVSAFDILKRIETERAFSSILLPEYEERLLPKDRALCHQLTLGVLRKQMFLDRAIDHFAGGKKIDLAVRLSLRLGLFQLLFLDKIPDHSAVNESVDLVGRAKKSSAKGFVNAVLRRALREPYSPEYSGETERISLETSHPRWLIEKWTEQFGLEETRRIAEANNQIPNAVFRLTAKSPPTASFQGVREAALVSGGFVADGLTSELSDAAARGEVYFQDEGSQLIGNSVKLRNSDRFLDVCAAPGSKVSQIAFRYAGERIVLVAGEIHPHRARFLLENCRSQGAGEVSVVRYDAETALPFADESLDAVLVDAPCSGTGTIRHNPEIRYFLKPADLIELSGKQLRILSNASKLVRKGGNLIYSTCSLETEENEAVADEFLASSDGFEKAVIDVPERLISEQKYARTLPHRDNMDGFFIAAFRRF